MSKDNSKLAKEIVDKLSVYREDDVQMGVVTIPVLSISIAHSIIEGEGEAATVSMPSEKQATSNAVKKLTAQLDAGEIVLSDTWIEDNLGGVK